MKYIIIGLLCISAYASASEISWPQRGAPVKTKSSEKDNTVNIDYYKQFVHVTKDTERTAQLHLINTSIPLYVMPPGMVARKIPGMSTTIGKAPGYGTIDVSNEKLLEGLFEASEKLALQLQSLYKTLRRPQQAQKLQQMVKQHRKRLKE